MKPGYLARLLMLFFLTACTTDETPEMAHVGTALSPWHSLTEAEIKTAAAALIGREGNAIVINRISLKEPNKQAAKAWQSNESAQRGADLLFRSGKSSFRASFDFGTNTLSTSTKLTTGQSMLVGEELFGAVETVSALPELVDAVSQRGIDPDYAICLPRTIGRFYADTADPVNDRLARFECFNIRGQRGLGILPTTSAYARPIEGLSVLFDVEENRVIDITDSYAGAVAPPADFEVLELDEDTLDTRTPLRPITMTQSEGHNFSVSGSQIDWQGWQFHLRFDPRQGTVLNNIGYMNGETFRPIAYEIAMSEMFVPYQDPDTHWFYRAYFDMGEYGFGNMATELKGNDCPANAVYQDVVLHTGGGDPVVAPNRVCIFEFDPWYPSWRHSESLLEDVPGLVTHNARRATNLVVRMVAVIGNYDYFQDYIFQQDGRIRIRLISTGIDATKGVFAKSLSDSGALDETAYGTLIAPHRLGVNHDHFFSYRIDMDVDGTENNFLRQKLVAETQASDASRQGIWRVQTEQVATEQAAQTVMRVEKPALLTFASNNTVNQMGYPTAYQLMFPNIRPLVTPEDPIYQRAGFLKNNLWVTRYQPDEIFSAGIAVNQSKNGVGLPVYAQDNESIKNTDIVAWPTIGFHHVPMAEDWPVMPAKVDEIVLKPRNFFDHNPALDVAN